MAQGGYGLLDPKDSSAGKRVGFLVSPRTGLGSPSSGVGGVREAVGMERQADGVVDCRSQLLAVEAVGGHPGLRTPKSECGLTSQHRVPCFMGGPSETPLTCTPMCQEPKPEGR